MTIAYTPPVPPRRGGVFNTNPPPRGLDWDSPRTPYVNLTQLPVPAARGATPVPKPTLTPSPFPEPTPVTPEPSYVPNGKTSQEPTMTTTAVDPGAGYNPGFVDPVQPTGPGTTNPNNPPPIVPPNVPGPAQSNPYLGLDFVRNITPNELVSNQLQALLNRDSPYMRNAEQRGVEFAQRRGNLNSSIAAGSARRAALEAAMPIANADAQAYREANSQNFEALSQLRQMRTAADLEDWLSDRSFNREFNGRLATMPIQSAMDMLQYVSQRAMEDPAVYTPQVMSGFMNFFNQNLFDIMNQYFGTNYGANPQGGG